MRRFAASPPPASSAEEVQVTRREFLALTGVAAAVGGRAPVFANPLGLPFGYQAWEVAPDMRKDWDGTLKTMKDFGYSYIDLNQVPPYTDKTAADLKASFTSHGFTFTNALWSYQAFSMQFDQTIADSQTLGLETIVCSPRPRLRTSDDWKSMADELNKYGERMKGSGLQLGYHNHEIEFVDIDGQVPYDVLMAGCDKDLVRFQIDVGNLTFAGKDAITYLKKYPERYFSMHAKDYLPGKASVPVGQGVLKWPEIFRIVKTTKIENYFAEVAAYAAGSLQKLTPWPTDSTDQLRQSYEYLHKLTV